MAGFYSTLAWIVIRERQLVRQPFCQGCPDDALTPAYAVDHIVPIRAGGAKRDPANLQSLCQPCHAEKSSAERDGRKWVALRYRGCDVDGRPRVAWGPVGDQPLGANPDGAIRRTKPELIFKKSGA